MFAPPRLPPARVLPIRDEATGLDGVIAIHSTALGPAAGGCRFWHYPSDADAHRDAVRLAEGMSYKNALAGLPLGGGKAVIRVPDRPFDRQALFAAFGRAVQRLGGSYITAEDVGTTVADMTAVASATRHVSGLPASEGRPGGDPSPWTARGVFLAMAVAAERRLGRPLSDCTVAIQGVGAVGSALAMLLHAAGARLIVADRSAEAVAAVAARTGADVVACSAVLQARCDIVAPCALGGVLDARAIAGLRASIVCGAANNQLAADEDGARLAERGVLYAPDYVVNSGGIVSVAGEYLGWSSDAVEARIDATGERLGAVLDIADADGVPANLAADAMAREAIAAAAPAKAALKCG
jgi:leucine dehydrogenase